SATTALHATLIGASVSSVAGMFLLNDLVGAHQHEVRDGEAERVGGLEGDHQLKLRGTGYWQGGWLLTRGDAPCIDANVAAHCGKVRSVAQEPPSRGLLVERRDCRHPMARCQRDKSIGVDAK